MYRFNSNNGFLIFPIQEKNFFNTYRIMETDGILKKIGLAIPHTSENFKDFSKTMKTNEQELMQNLIIDRIV